MTFINDQDIINYVFQNDIGCLPYIYNVTNLAFGLRNKIIKKYLLEWKEGIKRPCYYSFYKFTKAVGTRGMLSI